MCQSTHLPACPPTEATQHMQHVKGKCRQQDSRETGYTYKRATTGTAVHSQFECKNTCTGRPVTQSRSVTRSHHKITPQSTNLVCHSVLTLMVVHTVPHPEQRLAAGHTTWFKPSVPQCTHCGVFTQIHIQSSDLEQVTPQGLNLVCHSVLIVVCSQSSSHPEHIQSKSCSFVITPRHCASPQPSSAKTM
jgi:hypothetical protein